MALTHSPKIVTDNLVFAYDMNNRKSFKGKPTTNIAYHDGTQKFTIGNLTTTGISFSDLGNNKFSVTCTTDGTFRLNFDLSFLTNNTPYCISYKYKLVSASEFRAIDWCDVSVTRTETVIDDYAYVQAYATRATYDSTFRFMDFLITGSAQVVEVWDIQLEQGTFASPFVNGTRSNTQAILDQSTNARTVDVTQGLTYTSSPNSNLVNSFEFNGTNNYMSISPTFAPTNANYTLEAWVKRDVDNVIHGIMSDRQFNWLVFYITDTGQVYWGHKYYSDPITPAGETFITIVTSDGQVGTDYTHVVATFEVDVGAKIYVNGELEATGSNGNGFALGPGRGVEFIGTAFNSTAGGTNGFEFDGEIPITRLYSKNLSASEVKQNFLAGKSRFGV